MYSLVMVIYSRNMQLFFIQDKVTSRPWFHILSFFYVHVSRRIDQATSWTTNESWLDSREGHGIFSTLQNVQTDSEAHPSSCSVSGGLSRPRREADHILHLVLRLRIFGPVLLFHPVTTWRPQRPLYLFMWFLMPGSHIVTMMEDTICNVTVNFRPIFVLSKVS